MPRCNICNDLVFEVLPAPQWLSPSYRKKSFIIFRKAEEFKRAAASGCVPCSVVLQAIALYAPSVQAELVQTGLMSKGNIILSGNDNEPLQIEFHGFFRGGGDVRLELFEEWDHSENHAPLFSAVGLGSNPREVLDITYAGWRAKRWISRCDNEHECGGDDVPILPARVLAITSDPIKLIAPPSGTTGHFAALSYCWGSTGNLTTTLNNIKEREAGIGWETLPNLFQDVVQITRRMGIHFLWIDALCIIQDNQADWQKESAKMGDIYAGAYVTIACDSATDTSYRLTTPRDCALRSAQDSEESVSRDERLKALPPVVVDGYTHSFFARDTLDHWDILREPPWHDLSFPLLTRGWTMQERLFSGRVLHFTAHEMVWECQKTFYCECGGMSRDLAGKGDTAKESFERAKAALISDCMTPLPILTCPGDTLRNESFVRFWTQLMTTYTTRRLTFDSDRLPGISAIARNLGLAKTYMAGLWLEDLPWHFAWVVESNSKSTPPSVHYGPTWSWASVSAGVRWPVDMHFYRSQIRVMEASTAPVGLDEFGQVAWGRVRLQARVAAAKALKTADHSYPILVTPYGKFPFEPDTMCANTPFEEGQGQMPSGQRSARTVADNEDVWCFLVLADRDIGDEAFSQLDFWIMVAAEPNDQSVRRALLDPNGQPEPMPLVLERIGCIERNSMSGTYWVQPRDIWKWLSSSDFEVREVIII